MNIWVQSLSVTLIYALGQGLAVYMLLRLALRIIPTSYASLRYHVSFAALSSLLVWFFLNWIQQYHLLAATAFSTSTPTTGTITFLPGYTAATIGGDFISPRSSLSTSLFPAMCVLYIAGVSFMLIRMSVGILQLSAIRKTGIVLPDEKIESLFATLKEKMQIGRTVRLLLSETAHVPMLIGYFKPVIIVPLSVLTQLSAEQLETILLHELAHLKRNDYLINIIQMVIEALLFFNPFVWLISAICRKEREYSCDDVVLHYTQQPDSYAEALAAIATQNLKQPQMAIAATGKPKYLYNRIIRIMEMEKTQFSYSKKVAAAIAVLAITCSVAWVPPIFDDTETKNNKKVDSIATKSVKDSLANNTSEDAQLVYALMTDGVIDQVKGFRVEKLQNDLYIDGKKQPAAIAKKYLQHIQQEFIKVQVYPFTERLNMHPDAGFMQLLLPVSSSSPCVDMKTKKEGC